MNHHINHSLTGIYLVLTSILLATIIMSGCSKQSSFGNSKQIKSIFSYPPREYSTGPLWTWNDMLTEEQIKSSLADLADQGVRQVWVHPRPGLMTPYLGEEWFQMWKVTLDEAEKLDMNVWIYDENSYPSGFAGGLVPEVMPEARGKGVHMSEVTKPDNLDDNVLFVYQMTENGFKNITKQVREGTSFPEGRYLLATLKLASSGGWFGGKYYVDVLHPGVTEKFIDITMEAYRDHFGKEFGKRIPGWFTDEPHLRPAGGLHWSVNLQQDFKKKWGYDIAEHLPSLVEPLGDYKKIRYHYQQFLLEEFISKWAEPCYDYCEKHNIDFTGHYWEHGWPGASHGPDNMAMSAWQQRPGIDILMNEYREDVHAQFGNARSVKEIASVANQLGRTRTLCETYGAGGWDLRLEDMKRIGDWIYVLGVNTLNEHLTYVTIRGARKRDHPQSFSYHTPWWEGYHKMTGYFTRLSAALSAGQQVNHILLLEPSTTAWMYQPDPSGSKTLNSIGNSFQDMINELERQQVEYDLGCEDVINRHGSVKMEDSGANQRADFIVGKRAYQLVVLPPSMENITSTTMTLLEDYVNAGGKVLCCGEAPARVDGELSDRGIKTERLTGWLNVSVEQAVQDMSHISRDGLAIQRNPNDQGILFHHRRTLDDGDILFLVNTSIDNASNGAVYSSTAQYVEKWDLETGQISSFPFTASGKGFKVDYNIPPCGSLLLFFTSKPGEQANVKPAQITTIQPKADPSVRLVEPNVLTLDYVDVSAGGEKIKNTYFYKAQQFIFQKNGMDNNPWDSSVQFRDELISKTFPAESGFEASYRFTIEDKIPDQLWMVIERADLYSLTCNDQTVSPIPGEWWLDKAFGKIDISKTARKGENIFTIKASPMTIYHELESAYVLGHFSLKAVDKGFTIVETKPITLTQAEDQGWDKQGYPFYAAGVTYTETFDVAKTEGQFKVRLTNWYGSVAKVTVNDQLAGYIAYQPWDCDVTEWIKPGSNKVEVTVIGTLKNTLGPHHFGPVSGRAWPSMFKEGPETGPPAGKDYHTLSYGMFEPFMLEQMVE